MQLQVPRFKEVFNIIFKNQMENEKSKWDVHFVQGVPKVEKGESPFAVLRFAFLYDGKDFIEDIDNFDVSFRWNYSRRTI